MERLNKFIASTGYCSRRKADEIIKKGKVKVNGKVIKELGFPVKKLKRIAVGNIKLGTLKEKQIEKINPPPK